MQNKQTLSTFILLILAVAMGWMILHTNYKQHQTAQTTNPPPDAFATNVSITQMNSDGGIKNILSSPLIQQQSNGTTVIKTPHIVTHTSNTQKWTVNAKKGLIYDNNSKIKLNGSVKAKEKNNKLMMTTNSIVYDINKNIAETKQAVNFQQPGATINATGMTVDFNNGRIRLLSQTSGQYAADKHRT